MLNEMSPEGKVGYFGPWIGELGWELMTWQAWCRKQAKKFEKVYVSSFPDMAALYQDFAIFVPHTCQKRHLDWRDVSAIDCYKPDDVTQQIIPFKEYRVEEQEFILFGDKKEFSLNYPSLTDVAYVIHPRAINKGNKNYPYPLWVELVKKMVAEGNRVVSVGSHLDECVSGTEDCRGIPLKDLMGLLASSRMVIGQSSGVMHLAALCGTPTVVWGDSRTYFHETLEKRYKETWNPFKTPVKFIFDENWAPDPELVWQTVKENDPIYHNAVLLDKTLAKDYPPIPELKPVGKVNPEFVEMFIPARFSQPLQKAIKSGRYFLTMSWQEQQDTINHHYVSKNFENADYVKSLDHLLAEIKKHPVVNKSHVMEQPTETKEEEVSPEAVAQGKNAWI